MTALCSIRYIDDDGVDHEGTCDMDLDDILGELCDLETELHACLDKRASPTTTSTTAAAASYSTATTATASTTGTINMDPSGSLQPYNHQYNHHHQPADYTNSNGAYHQHHLHHHHHHHPHPHSGEAQLEHALSELNGLTINGNPDQNLNTPQYGAGLGPYGTATAAVTPNDCPQHQQQQQKPVRQCVTTLENAFNNGGHDNRSQTHKRVLSMDSTSFGYTPPGGGSSAGDAHPHPHPPVHSPSMTSDCSMSGYDSFSMQDYMDMSGVGSSCLDGISSVSSVSGVGGMIGMDTDSAFSDTMSLPSSGSHISVTTTSSQQSGSSTGSAPPSGPSPTPAHELALRPDLCTNPGSFCRHYEHQINSPVESHDKLKAEKIRLALDKIREANIQKLFVRAYTSDGSSKSILVDESMTVAEVCDILVTKNHATPSVHWSVVEHMPELLMERILEDHQPLVDNLVLWSQESSNKLLLVENRDKYDVFIHPEKYLFCPNKDSRSVENGYPTFNKISRQSLIDEHFSPGGCHPPELEGMLYLKAEGKKAWKKMYFVLRPSGLYYNPKGKGKSPKDLLSLQQLDYIEVFKGFGWKKKYKAPTDFGFALKHPQIQKKAPRYIRYICVEDEGTLKKWMTGIRIAKNGNDLLSAYTSAQNRVATWDSTSLLPNQALGGLLKETHHRDQQHPQQQHQQQQQQQPRDKDIDGDSAIVLQESPVQTPQEGVEFLPGDDSSYYNSNATLRRNRKSGAQIHDTNPSDVCDADLQRCTHKLIPALPVTTGITKQLAEQVGLNRKKSFLLSQHKASIDWSKDDLPPPPADMTDGTQPDCDDVFSGCGERKMSEPLYNEPRSPALSRTSSAGSYATLRHGSVPSSPRTTRPLHAPPPAPIPPVASPPCSRVAHHHQQQQHQQQQQLNVYNEPHVIDGAANQQKGTPSIYNYADPQASHAGLHGNYSQPIYSEVPCSSAGPGSGDGLSYNGYATAPLSPQLHHTQHHATMTAQHHATVSPQHHRPVYATPQQQSCMSPQNLRRHQTSDYSPQHVPSPPAPVTSPTLHQRSMSTGNALALMSPGSSKSNKVAPPPPRRSQTTRLSMRGEHPPITAAYQSREGSVPPPATQDKPPCRNRSASLGDGLADPNDLPPPPAELLEGLQQYNLTTTSAAGNHSCSTRATAGSSSSGAAASAAGRPPMPPKRNQDTCITSQQNSHSTCPYT